MNGIKQIKGGGTHETRAFISDYYESVNTSSN